MNEYQLIITIVNAGFSGTVMTIAKEAGARGGTVIHARGTGLKSMEKKYGIAIAPDKEMILIVANKEVVDDIMTAINNEAGIGTKIKAITFSLPVDHVSGLKY